MYIEKETEYFGCAPKGRTAYIFCTVEKRGVSWSTQTHFRPGFPFHRVVLRAEQDAAAVPNLAVAVLRACNVNCHVEMLIGYWTVLDVL